MEIWFLDQFEYAEFIGSVTASALDPKHYFGEILKKQSQNCQFQLKFDTKTSSNKQNSMVVFNFSVVVSKYPF